MCELSPRGLGVAAASAAMPYIASKVQYALASKLGVHGGPRVTEGDYRRFGSSATVAAAQWSNVLVGAMFSVAAIAPWTPLGARANRWVVAAPMVATSGLLTETGAFTLGRAVARNAGGAPFGGYLLGWGALVGAAARAYVTTTPQGQASPAESRRPRSGG